MPHVDDYLRSKPLPQLPPSENDSDRLSESSSSEEVQPRASLRIGAYNNTPHPSTDRVRNAHNYRQNTLRTPTPIINNTRGTHRLSHYDVLNEEPEPRTHPLEQPAEGAENVVGLLGTTIINMHKTSQPTTGDGKPSLIRRITSRLNVTVPATMSSPPMASANLTRPFIEAKQSSRFPRPSPTTHHSPSLPNSFVSRENREAALRERGLRPPPKDLSEQEREADERLAPVIVPKQGESAAARIKEEWLSVNRSPVPLG